MVSKQQHQASDVSWILWALAVFVSCRMFILKSTLEVDNCCPPLGSAFKVYMCQELEQVACSQTACVLPFLASDEILTSLVFV